MRTLFEILLLFSFFALPQVSQAQWQSLNLYDGPTSIDSDYHEAVTTMPNGDVLAAGNRDNNLVSNCSAALSLRRTGSINYERFYNQGGTTCNRFAHDVAYDALNNRIVLAGEAGGSPILHFIDPATGNLQTGPVITGSGSINAIEIAGNHLFIFGDYTGSLNIAGSIISGGNAFVARLDLNGVVQQVLDIPSAYEALDLVGHSSGGVYFSLATKSNIFFGAGIAGNYNGYGGTGIDYVVFSTDVALLPRWSTSVGHSTYNTNKSDLPIDLKAGGFELFYASGTGTNFSDATLGSIRTTDGLITNSTTLSNRAIHDLVTTCDKIIATGGHGSIRENREACWVTPHKLWLGRFDAVALSQDYLIESSTCAVGRGLTLSPDNRPVVVGSFWENSSLSVGALSQTITQNNGALTAQYYDPVLAQAPCYIEPCTDSLAQKTFSLYLNVRDSGQVISDPVIDVANSVIRESNGDITFAGQAVSVSGNGPQYVGRLDAAGNLTFTPQLLEINQADEVIDFRPKLIQTRNSLGNLSGYFGFVNLRNAGNSSRALVKYDLNLNPSFVRSLPNFSGSGDEEITAAIQNTNGDYILIGNYGTPTGGEIFALEVKANLTIGNFHVISEATRSLKAQEIIELTPSITLSNARYLIAGAGNSDEPSYYVLDQNLQRIFDTYFDLGTTGGESVNTGGLVALPNGGFAQVSNTEDGRLFLAYYPEQANELIAKFYLLDIANGIENVSAMTMRGPNELLIGGRAQQGPNNQLDSARAYILSFDPIAGTPNWLRTYGSTAYPAGAVTDIWADDNGLLVSGYGIDAIGAVQTGFGALNHYDSWIASTDSLGRIADCDCYDNSTVIISSLIDPFSFWQTSHQPGSQAAASNAFFEDHQGQAYLDYCEQYCPSEIPPPVSVCIDNLVINGNLESGTPLPADEDIDQASGWGPIWTTNNGNSTGDFYQIGMALPGALTPPLPASQSQWAGFWTNHTNNLNFREGVMASLSANVAQGSGTYELSFKLAALTDASAGTTQLAVYGVQTTSPAAAPVNGISPSSTLFTNQQLLTSITVPATLDENFVPFQFLVDASIFPASGISHLVFTNADTGGSLVYLALDDVCLRRVADCCEDESYFFNQVVPQTVIDSINPSTFVVRNDSAGPCHEVTIDWGDGTVEGPFPASQLPKTHNYNGNSNDRICVLIQEVGPDGTVCFDDEICYNYITPTREVELELTDLSVYPNPTTGLIRMQLRADESVSFIVLHDSFGRLLKQLDPQAVEFSLSGLPAGVYLFRIQTASGKQAVRRILLQ